jgi:small subunit ribosomal protein S18
MSSKVCPLDGIEIDYKNIDLLNIYITKFGKITP